MATNLEEKPPGANGTGGSKTGGKKQQQENKNDGKDPKRTKTKHKGKDFKGDTANMQGHVFQTFGEANDRMQFNKTVEALGHYINRNLKNPGDLVTLYKRIDDPTIAPPDEISNDQFANEREAWNWKEDMRRFKDCEIILSNNMHLLYAVIWGQCLETMKAKLEGLPGFDTHDLQCDCVWLLKAIRSTMYQFEGKKHLFVAMIEARTKLKNCNQKQGQNLTEFFHEFKETVEAFEHYGGSLGKDQGLINALIDVTDDECPGDPPEYDPHDPEESFLNALEYHTDMTTYRQKLEGTSRNKTLAIMFLQRVNRGRYSHLMRELHNEYTRGSDLYPDDLASAYTMVDTFVPPKSLNSNKKKRGNQKKDKATEPDLGPEVATPAFLQIVEEDDKPLEITNEFSALQIDEGIDTLVETPEFTASGYIFHQMSASGCSIPKTWILLDSQSTISVFHNKDFLTNIRESRSPIHLKSNGGGRECIHQVGDLTNFGTIWYAPNSPAKILSLADVRRQNRVTMDTAIEPALIVHRKDGSEMKFREFHSGLYYFDVATSKPTSANVSPYCLVQTVASIKSMYHRREIEAADRARELYVRLGRPSQKHFEFLLRNKLITDCNLTADDAKRAVEIYGPDIGALNGKMKNRKARPVPSFTPISVPEFIVDRHKTLTLSTDIFYVQGIPFLHTISCKIQFRTATYLPDRKKATILHHLNVVLNLYKGRGFTISDMHADLKFAPLRPHLQGINLNIVPQDEHVPEIERSTETVKERVRAMIHGLPYNRYPKAGIVQLVTSTIRSLKQIPAENGVSDRISPATLILGTDPFDYKKLLLSFGQYVQAFDCNVPTNTQRSRGIPAIAMSISPNENGVYFFLNLETARIISRRKFTPLLLSDAAIRCFEDIAKAENQPLIPNGCPTFKWAPGIEIGDPEDPDEDDDDTDDDADMDGPLQDTTQPEDIDDDNSSVDSNAELPSLLTLSPDNDDSSVLSSTSTVSSNTNPTDDLDTMPEASDNPTLTIPDDISIPAPDNSLDPSNDLPPAAQRSVDTPSDPNEPLNEAQRSERTGYNLRPKPPQTPQYVPHSYDSRLNFLMTAKEKNRLFNINLLQTSADVSYHMEQKQTDKYFGLSFLQQATSKADTSPGDLFEFVCHFMFTQMHADKGIATYGQRAIDALLKEFAQLNDLTTFGPLNPTDLTSEQKRNTLPSINLIKEKQCGRIKGHSVADGRRQRHLYDKADITSPTVSTDALLLTMVINAMEQREVATADIPGAYLQADMPDFVILKMKGKSVDVMCQMDPTYSTFVTHEKHEKVLYLQLKKALYGCVKSAMLWYNLFRETLEKMGFGINPYDPCVSNRMIKGKQCTIVWYVDDLKISHMRRDVILKILDAIQSKFDGELTITTGKEHTYLGMEITYTDKKRCRYG